jgi:hypothetical protein
MRLTHLYTGPDGQSHFADCDLATSPTSLGTTSAPFPAESVFFRDTDGGVTRTEFHPAPRRQLVILLSGRVEYECGDGSRREFGVGDLLLADDTEGQGHRARVLESPRFQVFVPLPSDLDLPLLRPHDDPAGTFPSAKEPS